MKLNELAVDYQESARRIHERILQLKKKQKSKAFSDDEDLEERIATLAEEHTYLLRMSDYLAGYYNHTPKKEPLEITAS